MRLKEIPPHTKVYLDANIFIYHFTGVSEDATALLARCEKKELTCITSVHTLGEALHRLITIEAASIRTLPPGKVVTTLKRHPEFVQALERYQAVLKEAEAMNIQILTLSLEDLKQAQEIVRQEGLLLNDAITLSLMKRHHISSLASGDRDFTRIPHIKLYQPELKLF